MDANTNTTTNDGPCHVEVWFGRQRVCDHRAAPGEAAGYAAAMKRRFRGLRVTVDGRPYDGPDQPVSAFRAGLWALTVK